jgi:hypothetical protein
LPSFRALPAILFALALILGGCGSGSSSTSSSTASGPAADTSTAPSQRQRQRQLGQQPAAAAGKDDRHPEARGPTDFAPPTHHDSGGGAKQFETDGGDNSIQEFGAETSSEEFSEAAATLHAFLDARAARAWAAACERLAPLFAESLVKELGPGRGAGSSCAEVLAGLTGPVPAATLREAAVADVGSFRVEGDRGFILFRDAEGQAYFMPMAREGGRWKVAAIAASPLY